MSAECGSLVEECHCKEGADAFLKGDYRRALEVCTSSVCRNKPDILYILGLMYENGWGLEAPDYVRAKEAYSRMMMNWSLDEGYIGCARIILKTGDLSSISRAESYCREAIQSTGTPFAFMLLGRISLKLYDPPNIKAAKSYFISGGLRGSAWCWRLYANALKLEGRVVSSFIVHVLATFAFPMYRMILGRRALRFE